MKAETEIWQVLTQGEVYQADLPTLKQWIFEGLVQPADRVRKGNFRWIEAQRAPLLRRVFAGEELPPFETEGAEAAQPAVAASSALAHDGALAAQPQASVSGAQASAAAFGPQSRAVVFGTRPAAEGHAASAGATTFDAAQPDAQDFIDDELAARGFIEVVTPGAEEFGAGEQDAYAGSGAEWGVQGRGARPAGVAQPGLDSTCRLHPAQDAALVCRACFATFCRACPNKVGASSVLLCPLCGSFCDPLEGVKRRETLFQFQGSGFGLEDFKTALAYPFKHTASLIGGALLYAFFLIGGLRTQLLASALAYGCISLVIHRVGYGNLKRDFMPDFSEFDFWDDVLRPCFLGLAVTLVTLGPTLLLLSALLFGLFGGGERKPRTPAPPHAQAVAQEESGAATREEPEAAAQESGAVAPGDMGTLINGGTAEQEEELAKKVQGMRPTNRVAQQLEQSKQGDDTALSVVRQLMARPGLIVLLTLLSLAWAVFYHPMALLVAGWTESFKSVMNPAVGLDTMRHMGMNYAKAFLMYACVQAVGLFVTSVVSVLTSPFDMPFVGNLPGTFVTGVVTFYTSLVIACVLGLALFKSADRLGIEID